MVLLPQYVSVLDQIGALPAHEYLKLSQNLKSHRKKDSTNMAERNRSQHAQKVIVERIAYKNILPCTVVYNRAMYSALPGTFT